ncbi:MAG TPA: sensor histidine kinase [Anaerolineae bacterium]|nr:sensor histidine kinase [Anaerolineae bacterium]
MRRNSMIRFARRRLGWKLFLSYLAVILVGLLILATATEFAVPTAFGRHMAAMAEVMGEQQSSELEEDFFLNFRSAVTEAIAIAGVAAFLAALIVSWFVSRQVVRPVREIMVASRRIAEGHYDERVGVPGNAERDELDELAQLALSFNQMAARLEQTETRRLELIGNVAHELRTPLASIKGYMEGLIDGVLPADAATFQQVYREADRLQRLVHDLQELSRVEAGAYELNLHPVPPERLVEGVTARLGRQFEEKGVALETDLPPDLPPVLADEDRIGQVLLNLVGNALQYTPSGGRVRLSVRREGGMVAFAVQDTGIGIAPEHLMHVFERFYRVDRSRSRAGGGSGIGLTIARYLVEAHGGRITAASEGLGQGATFRFVLPVA